MLILTCTGNTSQKHYLNFSAVSLSVLHEEPSDVETPTKWQTPDDKRRWKHNEEAYLCRKHVLTLDELELRVRDGYGCCPDDAVHWGSCQLEELSQPVLYITLQEERYYDVTMETVATVFFRIHFRLNSTQWHPHGLASLPQNSFKLLWQYLTCLSVTTYFICSSHNLQDLSTIMAHLLPI